MVMIFIKLSASHDIILLFFKLQRLDERKLKRTTTIIRINVIPRNLKWFRNLNNEGLINNPDSSTFVNFLTNFPICRENNKRLTTETRKRAIRSPSAISVHAKPRCPSMVHLPGEAFNVNLNQIYEAAEIKPMIDKISVQVRRLEMIEMFLESGSIFSAAEFSFKRFVVSIEL
jgi:hypothetical protein